MQAKRGETGGDAEEPESLPDKYLSELVELREYEKHQD